MASSGNFPVLNDLYRGERGTNANFYGIIEEGNTNLRSRSNNDALQISTFEGLKSGKWYWEWSLISPGGDRLMHSGAADSRRDQWNYAAASATYGAEQSIHFHTYFQIIEKNGSDTGAYSSSASSHSDDDVFGFALDVDNGKAYVHKNGTYYASGNPATGANPGATWTPASEYTDGFTPYFTASGGTDANGHINFGQDSTFGGRITAGGNADGNGFGDFKYTPPTGFLAVCSANLPISDDIDPAQTDDDIPIKQFGAYKYTGNSGTAVTVSTDFQPDLIWIKSRDSTDNHYLQDSSRGFGNSKSLSSNTTGQEGYNGGAPSSSGAQNVGATSFQAYGNDWSKSTDNMIAWCWRANGGTTASNSDGDITSTVQANTDAGFSIVTYSGTLSSSGTASVGHGLTKKPDFLMSKARTTNNDNGNWHCSHVGLTNFNYRIRLNTTEAQADRSSAGDMASLFTNSTFGTNYTSGLNVSGDTFVAYVWHSVEGYSKFGSYIGNGDSDGPFVYLGFRPALLALKRITSSGAWNVFDSGRKTFNSSSNPYIVWSNSDAEANGVPVDFLSNGFKIRSSGAGVNASGATFIYMAWGDVPFKYNNTF